MSVKYSSVFENNSGTQKSIQPQLNISATDLKTLECEGCKGVVFAEGTILKTVSALLTGNGKEGILPIPAFYCVKCNQVIDRLLPEDMRMNKLVA